MLLNNTWSAIGKHRKDISLHFFLWQQAKLAVADYQGAMEDASEVIAKKLCLSSVQFKSFDKVLVTLRYPNNPGALLVQGDALYHTGLFEHSLVSYYKVM